MPTLMFRLYDIYQQFNYGFHNNLGKHFQSLYSFSKLTRSVDSCHSFLATSSSFASGYTSVLVQFLRQFKVISDLDIN